MPPHVPLLDRVRRDLGAIRDAVHFRVTNRATFRSVRAQLQIPPLPKMTGETWAIMMVKDEQDIIRRTIEHTLSQGVDGILVMDNGSADDTPRILRECSNIYPVFVGRDTCSAYEQAVKMTLLADAVRRRGAAWIVPIDADELWFGKTGSLPETLDRSGGSIVRAQLFNLLPADEDDGSFKLDTTPTPWQKVAFRASRYATIGMGNHSVYRVGAVCDGLAVCHIPLRSFSQFTRKVSNGSRAIEETGLEDSAGVHWRRLGHVPDLERLETWRAVVQEQPLASNFWLPYGPTVPADIDDLDSWASLEKLVRAAGQ